MADEISLRELLENKLAALAKDMDKATAAHVREHELIAKALEKSDETMAVKLLSMNEWRDTTNDLTSRFVTKERLDTVEATFREKIESMDRNLDSRREAVIMRVAALERQSAQNAGRERGIALSWGVIGSLIVMSIALAGLAVKVLGS
jgi:hypothetical protein